MKKSLKTLKLAAIGFAITASLPALASHTWNNYHWARNTTNWTLQVVDSVDANWQSTFDQSLQKWSGSWGASFNVATVEDDSRTRKRCAMVPGQMRVCNAAYGTNGWLGLASINLDSQGHIKQGTAKMNDSYSSYFTQEEMNHVMCQEIGHVFGLGHTSEDGSSQRTCMDYSTDVNSQWPNSHDFQMLNEMYNHLDSYNSYTESGSGGTPCHGKNCKSSEFGIGHKVYSAEHYEVWVTPEADGTLTVHHVYLADGHNH